MEIEIISWPISKKDCYRAWGSNLRPSAYQADMQWLSAYQADALLTQRVPSEDSDQTVQMRRLIWVFTGSHIFI